MSAKICLVLTEKTLEKNLTVLEKYRSYIDMAELRVDFLNQREILYLREFPKKAKLPCILTIRRKTDGGLFVGGEARRMTIFARGLAFANSDPSKNFAYIDLEHDFDASGIEEAARVFNIKIIRSLHSKKTVKNIVKTLKELKQCETDIPKLAFKANSLANMAEIFKAAEKLKRQEFILTAMGNYGLSSRILANKIHSHIVYAFSAEYIKKKKLEKELLDPITLHKLYNFRNINAETKIFGVAGDDVNLSLSPHIHNKAFRQKKINSCYIPISSKNTEELMGFANLLKIYGLSITAPFKTDIISKINSVSEDSKSIGAVNTILNKGQKWIGYNMDVEGFRQALTEFLDESDLSRYKIAVIGAGGAAKAVAKVIKGLNGKACIFNRTAEPAKKLAMQYDFDWAILDLINAKKLADYSRLIIQTTSAGMEPDTETDPLSFYTFTGKEKVFELIYRPETTKLLGRARNAGCQVCNGFKMLEYQASAQFNLFTKIDEYLK